MCDGGLAVYDAAAAQGSQGGAAAAAAAATTSQQQRAERAPRPLVVGSSGASEPIWSICWQPDASSAPGGDGAAGGSAAAGAAGATAGASAGGEAGGVAGAAASSAAAAGSAAPSFVSVGGSGEALMWTLSKAGLVRSKLLRVGQAPEKDPLGGGEDAEAAADDEDDDRTSRREEDEDEDEESAAAADGPLSLAEPGTCLDFCPELSHVFAIGSDRGALYFGAHTLGGAAPLGGGGGAGSASAATAAARRTRARLARAHSAAVYAARYSPFHPRVLMTASADWTLKLWAAPDESGCATAIGATTAATATAASDDPAAALTAAAAAVCPPRAPPTAAAAARAALEDPLLLSLELGDAAADAAWSPACSTVVAAATEGGRLLVFDLARSPALAPVCARALGGGVVVGAVRPTRVAFSPHHPLLIVGDSLGRVAAFKLSPSLRGGVVSGGGSGAAVAAAGGSSAISQQHRETQRARLAQVLSVAVRSKALAALGRQAVSTAQAH